VLLLSADAAPTLRSIGNGLVPILVGSMSPGAPVFARAALDAADNMGAAVRCTPLDVIGACLAGSNVRRACAVLADAGGLRDLVHEVRARPMEPIGWSLCLRYAQPAANALDTPVGDTNAAVDSARLLCAQGILPLACKTIEEACSLDSTARLGEFPRGARMAAELVGEIAGGWRRADVAHAELDDGMRVALASSSVVDALVRAMRWGPRKVQEDDSR